MEKNTVLHEQMLMCDVKWFHFLSLCVGLGSWQEMHFGGLITLGEYCPVAGLVAGIRHIVISDIIRPHLEDSLISWVREFNCHLMLYSWIGTEVR